MQLRVIVLTFLIFTGCASENVKGPIVPVDALDHPPHLIFQPAPSYTEIWTRSRLPAQAVVSLTIEEDGSVSDVVLELSTKPKFGTAAIKAVEQYRFDPVTRGGEVVRTRFRVEVDGEDSVKFRKE